MLFAARRFRAWQSEKRKLSSPPACCMHALDEGEKKNNHPVLLYGESPKNVFRLSFSPSNGTHKRERGSMKIKLGSNSFPLSWPEMIHAKLQQHDLLHRDADDSAASQPASQKERTFKVEIKTGKKLLVCAAGYRLAPVFISIQQLWGIPPSDTRFGSWSFGLLMVPHCLQLQNGFNFTCTKHRFVVWVTGSIFKWCLSHMR